MSSHFPSDSTFAVDYNAPQQSGPPPRFDIVRMLRQNIFLIIGVSLLIAIPACAAVWFLTPLEYRVTGQLMLRASAPTVLGNEEPRAWANFDKWLTSQLEFIQGPTVLQRVANDRAVREIPEVKKAASPLEFLERKVTADSNRNSEIVTVSVRMKDGAGAQTIVSKVMEEYLNFATNLELNKDNEVLKTLKDEARDLEDALAVQNDEIAALQERLGIPVVNVPQIGPSEMESTRTALTTAQENLSEAQSKIATIEQRIERLNELKAIHETNPTEKLWDLGIEESVKQNAGVQSLRSTVVADEAALAVIQERYTPQHAQRRVAEENFATLQRKLQQEEIKVRREVLEMREATLEAELEDAQKSKQDAEERIKNFESIIETHDTKVADSAATYHELKELEADRDQKRERLATVKNRIDELTIERKAPGRIEKLAEPVVPSSPDYGRRFQLMFLAVFGACTTGLGLALLKELLNKQVRTAQDIASVTPLPLLANIPHTNAAKLPKNVQPEMVVADHPHTPIAEEFRRLVARIVYPSDETIEVNSCLVASPTRSDGKTTLACNLALSLAQANRRVLLVDVCSRNPQVEAHFGLEAEEGLSEVLFERAPFLSVVRATEFSDLMIMGPGLHTSHLQGKLASREMMAFLEEAEKSFDHVILDTPPSLLMSDAKLLSPIVDAVVVTVGVGKSSVGMLRRALVELEQVNANIIGVVLNGIRHTRGGYMAKNFALYEKYSLPSNGHFYEEPLPEMHVEDDSEEPIQPAVVLIPSDGSGESADENDRDEDEERLT